MFHPYLSKILEIVAAGANLLVVVSLIVLFVTLVFTRESSDGFFRYCPAMRFIILIFSPFIIVLWPLLLIGKCMGGLDDDDLND